jgi:hypothetical protein
MFKFLQANGGRVAEGEYRIVKRTRGNGKFFYQLQQVVRSGWKDIQLYKTPSGLTPYRFYSSLIEELTLQEMCNYIEQEKKKKVEAELRKIVKEEVVECCTPRKIN